MARIRAALARSEPIVYPLGTLAVIGIVWELSARTAHSLWIPTFTQTLAALAALLVSPRLWDALALSNQALAIGFAISLVGGIPLGLALGRYRRLAGFLDSYITILLTVPMAGVIPLLVMSVGIGLEARVAVVVMFAIVILVVNTRAGVRQVDPSLIEMARSFGANEPMLWRRVLLPASVPAIMVGVRIAIGHAVTGMVVVELLLVAVGIGRVILEFQSQFNPAGLYASVIVVIFEALIVISLADRVARAVAPWSRRHPA